MSEEQDDEISDNDTMGGRGDPFVLLKKSTHQRRRNTDMSDHLIAEANRHAKALPKMTLPTTKPNDRDLAWYIAECIDLKKQLEMECAAKREHLRIACAEIDELKAKAGFYEREIARLRSENAALKNQANDEFDTVITRNIQLERENAALRELAARMATEMREVDHEFASLRDYDAARKEAQPIRAEHSGDINEMMQKAKEAQP